MITHFRHAGIVVANLERALSFWCGTLGFRVIKQAYETGSFIDSLLGLTGVHVTTSKLAAPDGNLIELLYFHSHSDRASWTGMPFSTGLTHLAFTVDDIDADYARLGEAGVMFLTRPQVSPDGFVKVVYASGPEGLLLEFVEVLKT